MFIRWSHTECVPDISEHRWHPWLSQSCTCYAQFKWGCRVMLDILKKFRLPPLCPRIYLSVKVSFANKLRAVLIYQGECAFRIHRPCTINARKQLLHYIRYKLYCFVENSSALELFEFLIQVKMSIALNNQQSLVINSVMWHHLVWHHGFYVCWQHICGLFTISEIHNFWRILNVGEFLSIFFHLCWLYIVKINGKLLGTGHRQNICKWITFR